MTQQEAHDMPKVFPSKNIFFFSFVCSLFAIFLEFLHHCEKILKKFSIKCIFSFRTNCFLFLLLAFFIFKIPLHSFRSCFFFVIFLHFYFILLFFFSIFFHRHRIQFATFVFWCRQVFYLIVCSLARQK